MTKDELEKSFLAKKAARKLEEWAKESNRPARNGMLVKNFIEKHDFSQIVTCLWYVNEKRSIPYYGYFDKVLEHTGKPYIEKTVIELKVS